MTTHHDDLELSLERLTAGPAEAPGLWRRALERGATPRPAPRWRSWLAHPSPRRIAVTGVAACVLLGLIIAGTMPALKADRRAASMEVREQFGGEAASWRSYGYTPDAQKWKGAAASPAADTHKDTAGRAAEEHAKAIVLGQVFEPMDQNVAAAHRDASPTGDRQVVRKATMELETPDVAAAFAKVTHAVSEARGEYVQDSSLAGEGDTARATLTLRIAADRLGAALIELRQLGTVKNENTAGEDVTGQAVDLDARLRNEQRIEAELLGLLEKRADAPLKDVLELRQSLSTVRESIERLTAQRQHLSRLVSLATVLVIIRSPAAAEKPPAPAGLWTYFSKNISASWTMALAFLADTVATLLRIVVGGIIWWVLAAIVVVLALRHHRRTLARGI